MFLNAASEMIRNTNISFVSITLANQIELS
jgi:hypothetical protein